MKSWKERLAESKWMTDADKELFLKFAEDAVAHQIKERRIEKYRSDFSSTHKMTGMTLTAIVKDIGGLRQACSKINEDRKYQALTKKDIKRLLGSLFCFVKYEDRSMQYAPKEVKELTRHLIKASDKRLAKPVITREEIRELSKFGNTIDKAILWLLFESGMRMGEFVQLKKSDITQVDEGLIVRVPPAKTGEREVIVVEATKFVLAWLNEHPVKGEDAPLWLSIDTKKPLTQGGMAKRIRGVIEKLNKYRQKKGIPLYTTPINPHNFRHSRASELGGAEGMTEQMLDKYLGWEIGSNMPRTYLHLTSAQVKKAILRTYGKAKPEEEKKIATDWICPKCQEKNPLSLNYCGKCGNTKEGKIISKTVMLEDRINTLEGKLKKYESYIAKLTKEELRRRVKA